MSDTISTQKTHPAIVIAAATLILTCLLAIGVMTGLVPSPLTRGTATQQEVVTAPAPIAPTNAAAPLVAPREYVAPRENHPVARAPVHEQRHMVERDTPRHAPVGATTSSAPSHSVAGSAPAAPPVCTTCATVTSVNAIREQGEASMIGPAAGGVIGGLAGHQIGGGTGKTIATIAGAAVGAGVGTEVERRTKGATHYNVNVRMYDGTVRTVRYDTAPDVQSGDRVRVVNGRLIHD